MVFLSNSFYSEWFAKYPNIIHGLSFVQEMSCTFITIDVGSSYIKAVLLNLEKGRIVETEKQATPAKMPSQNPRVFEIAAKEIFETVKDIIADYCKRYSGVEGVLFSTQMHGCVYSDHTYGEDVYISWQDTRCLDDMLGTDFSYMEYLQTRFPIESMQNTGVEIEPALALCNLYVLLHERNFQIGQSAKLYTLGLYLIAGITGKNVCNIQNAAPMGMVDITKGTWRDDILREVGMSGISMPEIVTGFELCGRGNVAGVNLNVYPDFGDQQMSVLGCGASVDDMILNIATGAQVILLQQGIHFGNYEIRPFFEGIFCNVVSRMPAGATWTFFWSFFAKSLKRSLEKPSRSERDENAFKMHLCRRIPKGLSQISAPTSYRTSSLQAVSIILTITTSHLIIFYLPY